MVDNPATSGFTPTISAVRPRTAEPGRHHQTCGSTSHPEQDRCGRYVVAEAPARAASSRHQGARRPAKTPALIEFSGPRRLLTTRRDIRSGWLLTSEFGFQSQATPSAIGAISPAAAATTARSARACRTAHLGQLPRAGCLGSLQSDQSPTTEAPSETHRLRGASHRPSSIHSAGMSFSPPRQLCDTDSWNHSSGRFA